MGLGGLRPSEKAPEVAAEEGEASTGAAAKGASRPGWGALAGRKKSVAQVQEEQEKQAADDRAIRFTIGGVGKRMTKEDFIREVQQLDARTRKEVIDQSSASIHVKNLARQDPPVPVPQVHDSSDSTDVSPERSESNSPIRKPGQSSRSFPNKAQPSDDLVETAVERKRRLAVLSSQADNEDTGETPAERRRREAALGVGGGDGGEDSSDEGDTQERRGIRFADLERGRKA